MGNCSCWKSPLLELSSLQSTSKPMENSPIHIPNMHPKIYDLAEKVFANQSDTVACINLSNRDIGDDGGRYLSAIIPYLQNLHFLNLKFLNISHSVWEQIFGSLMEIESLKHLEISSNLYNDKSIEFLSKCLSTNQLLEVLIMESTGLGSLSAIILSAGLSVLLNLKVLILNNNFIDDNAMKCISNGLSRTKSLQVLDLSKNLITHKSSVYLTEMKINLKSLSVFKIGGNNIRDEGLASAIKNISVNIEEIDISDIRVSSNGLAELFKTLPRLEKLKYLVLDYNVIDYRCSKILVETLSQINLEKLSLVGCDVSEFRKELSLAQQSTEVLI